MLVVAADQGGPIEAVTMSTWDARGWVSGLMGLARDDLRVRSIDHYGDSETQVRYEHEGVAVARLTVTGPVRPFMSPAGGGHWEIRALIGSGMADAHVIEVPETDEVVYE